MQETSFKKKLINPRSEHVFSTYLAFKVYRQFDVSLNDDNEQENLEVELEQVEFNDLNAKLIELIETIQKVSNLLQNKTWTYLLLPARMTLSSLSRQIGKSLKLYVI